MKNKTLILSLLLVAVFLATTFMGCKKDENAPASLTLSSLKVGDIELNGTTPATDVPVKPEIVAIFSTDIDASTVTTSNIALVKSSDDTNVSISLTTSGKSITINTSDDLDGNTGYKLTLGAGLKSSGGQALTETSVTFTTGAYVPAGQIAHWNFEENADDQVGTYSPEASGIVDITYTASRNSNAGQAATFNGSTSIIEIPNGDQLINTSEFAMSFWVKTNSTKGTGLFVIGLGAFFGLQFEIEGSYEGAKFAVQYEQEDHAGIADDLRFGVDEKDKDNGGWQGCVFAKSITSDEMISLLKDTWLHVTFTFSGTTKKGTIYYNGEKMKVHDFNLWPDGDPKQTIIGMKWGGSEPDVVNEMAFGFIQSRAGTLWDTEPWGGYDFPDANHFKGQLDDIHIFHKALSEEDVLKLYNSEK